MKRNNKLRPSLVIWACSPVSEGRNHDCSVTIPDQPTINTGGGERDARSVRLSEIRIVGLEHAGEQAHGRSDNEVSQAPV